MIASIKLLRRTACGDKRQGQLLQRHETIGPDPGNRTVLALASGTRHPGIAMAIAGLNFPDEPGVAALIVYHLVIGALVSAPYIRWRVHLGRRLP
jgi:hypothetical protein